MARGGIGTARRGKAALKPVLSSSPGILGGFVPGQGYRVKGQEPKLGSRVELRPSLPKLHCRLSGDLPHSLMAGGLIALWRQTEAP